MDQAIAWSLAAVEILCPMKEFCYGLNPLQLTQENMKRKKAQQTKVLLGVSTFFYQSVAYTITRFQPDAPLAKDLITVSEVGLEFFSSLTFGFPQALHLQSTIKFWPSCATVLYIGNFRHLVFRIKSLEMNPKIKPGF